MRKKALLLAKEDNVAVVLDDVSVGEDIEISGFGVKDVVECTDKIDLAHKISTRTIEKGDKIIKYGEIIGVAKTHIDVGRHVHVHNILSTRIKEA